MSFTTALTQVFVSVVLLSFALSQEAPKITTCEEFHSRGLVLAVELGLDFRYVGILSRDANKNGMFLENSAEWEIASPSGVAMISLASGNEVENSEIHSLETRRVELSREVIIVTCDKVNLFEEVSGVTFDNFCERIQSTPPAHNIFSTRNPRSVDNINLQPDDESAPTDASDRRPHASGNQPQ